MLVLAAVAAHAQAPAWAFATSGNNAQPIFGTSAAQAMATDPATGSVYVTGTFTGSITFGNTLLTSTGGDDVFVAKWDLGARAWTSAVSGGGPGDDSSQGIAVVSVAGVASVYVTGTASNPGIIIAGTALNGAGGRDVFVAKYTDAGAGLTMANGGAVRGRAGPCGAAARETTLAVALPPWSPAPPPACT